MVIIQEANVEAKIIESLTKSDPKLTLLATHQAARDQDHVRLRYIISNLKPNLETVMTNYSCNETHIDATAGKILLDYGVNPSVVNNISGWNWRGYVGEQFQEIYKYAKKILDTPLKKYFGVESLVKITPGFDVEEIEINGLYYYVYLIENGVDSSISNKFANLCNIGKPDFYMLRIMSDEKKQEKTKEMEYEY